MKGEKRKLEGHLYHGYDRTVQTRGMRQHRRPHFTFGSMDVTEPSAKRARTAEKTKNDHEAQMIPGVDGKLMFGFPRSIITKLRYIATNVATASAGTLYQYTFGANSIFDPDVTGVGHQPLYRDQYAALYENYVVLGSKITITWNNSNTATPYMCTINADNDSTTQSHNEFRAEQSNSVHSMLSTDGGKSTLFMTYSPERDIGTNGTDVGITPMGSNPTNPWYFIMGVQGLDSVSSVTGVQWIAEIEYTVKFTELLTAAAS